MKNVWLENSICQHRCFWMPISLIQYRVTRQIETTLLEVASVVSDKYVLSPELASPHLFLLSITQFESQPGSVLLSTPLVFNYPINSPCFLTRTQSQFTFCLWRCSFTTYIFNSFLDCYSNLYEFDRCPDQNESVCNTWRSSSIAIKRAHSPLIARLSSVTQWCNCLFLKEAAEEEEDS